MPFDLRRKLGEGHAEFLGAAPSNRGSFNGQRLDAVARENPAYESGADRHHDGTPEPAAAWREVTEFGLTRKRLAA